MNENRGQHKFLYCNKKTQKNNSTVSSVTDTGLPGIYWDEMGNLALVEVTCLNCLHLILNDLNEINQDLILG